MTPELLVSAVGCTPTAAAVYCQHLTDACAEFGITGARLAAFLAQIGHESGSFKYVRELASGEAYEGRKDLGNLTSGDGTRYRGRGLIQITGRSNYAWMTALLFGRGAPDFQANPEQLELPKWAAFSAAAFWRERGLNELADAGEFERITRKINGGLNGQADRLARWERAKKALADVVVPAKQDTPAQPEPKQVDPFTLAGILELAKSIPKLIGMFGDSDMAQRNAKAADVVVSAVSEAVGASNVQEAVAKVQADPSMAAAANKAVERVWFDISEAAGGFEAARKADQAAFSAGVKPWMSPSMWAALALVPLAYIIVGSVVGLWGSATWSDELRAAIGSAVISLVVGGMAGYYWGATTTRNKA